MSSSIASITPQTAPRDPEGLKKAGIFQLRTLIERLGGLSNEEQKMAFARMSVDEKVVLAMQLLQQFDRANPGASQQAPPQQQHMNGQNGAGSMPAPMASVSMPFQGQQVATVPGQMPQQQAPAFGGFPQQQAPQPTQFAPQPQMQGGFAPQPQMGQQGMMQQPLPMGAPQVAMVDPAALAAAQAAASPAPTTTGRQPRNKATKDDAGPDLGEKVLNALTGLAQTVQASTEATAGAIREVTTALDELRKESPKEQLKGLHDSYRGVYQVLSQWDGRLTQIQNSSNLSIMLSLMLLEQTTGAPRDQILQAAIGDMGSLQALLSGTPGKG